MKKTLAQWCDEHEELGEVIRKEFIGHRNTGGKVDINTIGYNSKSIVCWRCSRCGHSYTMRIVDRIKDEKPCYICSIVDDGIVGKTFGSLKVLRELPRQSKHYAIYNDIQHVTIQRKDYTREQAIDIKYICKCKCKSIKVLTLRDLLHMHGEYCGKDCDNYKRQFCKNYGINYKGKLLCSMQVIEQVDSDYIYKHIGDTKYISNLYKCRCYHCGRETQIDTTGFDAEPPMQGAFGYISGYTSKLYCACIENKININKDKFIIITDILNKHNIPYLVGCEIKDLLDTRDIPLIFDICIYNHIDIQENNKFNPTGLRCILRLDRIKYRNKYKQDVIIDEKTGKEIQEVDISSSEYKENDSRRDEYARSIGVPMIKIPMTLTLYRDIQNFLKRANII